MKGTILDFLHLINNNNELAKGIAELAKKHGFEFEDELRDEDLEKVAGGLLVINPIQSLENELGEEAPSDEAYSQAVDAYLSAISAEVTKTVKIAYDSSITRVP